MAASNRRHVVLQYWRAAAVGEGLTTFGNPSQWETILDLLLKAARGTIRPDEASKVLAERVSEPAADGADAGSASEATVGHAVRFVQDAVKQRSLRDSLLLHLVAFLAFERSRRLIRALSVPPEWLEAADHVFLSLDSQGTGCCFADCILLAFASVAPLEYLRDALIPSESPCWALGGCLTQAMGAHAVAGSLSSMGAVSLDTWKRCLWSLSVPSHALRQWRARLVRLFPADAAGPWTAAVDTAVPTEDAQIVHALRTRGFAVWTQLSGPQSLPPTAAVVVRSLVAVLSDELGSGTTQSPLGNEWLNVEMLRWWATVEKVWNGFVHRCKERVRHAVRVRSAMEAAEGAREEEALAVVGAAWQRWVSQTAAGEQETRLPTDATVSRTEDEGKEPDHSRTGLEETNTERVATVKVKLFGASSAMDARKPVSDEGSSSESDCVLDDSDSGSDSRENLEDEARGHAGSSQEPPSFRVSVPVATGAAPPSPSVKEESPADSIEEIASRLAKMRASLWTQTAAWSDPSVSNQGQPEATTPPQAASRPDRPSRTTPPQTSAQNLPGEERVTSSQRRTASQSQSPAAKKDAVLSSSLQAVSAHTAGDAQDPADSEEGAWDADVAALRHALEFRRAMGPTRASGTSDSDAHEFSHRSMYHPGHIPTFAAIAEGARELATLASEAGRSSHATMALRIAEWAALLAQTPGVAPAAVEEGAKGSSSGKRRAASSGVRGRPLGRAQTAPEFASPGELSSPGWSPRPMRPVDAARVPIPESRRRSRTPRGQTNSASYVMETPAGGGESTFDLESWPRSARPSPMGLSALPTSPPVTPGLGQPHTMRRDMNRTFFPESTAQEEWDRRRGSRADADVADDGGGAQAPEAPSSTSSSRQLRKARHLRTVSRGRGQVLSPDQDNGAQEERTNRRKHQPTIARELWNSGAGETARQRPSDKAIQPKAMHHSSEPSDEEEEMRPSTPPPPVRAYKARLSHIPHQGTTAVPSRRTTKRGWRATATSSSSHGAETARQSQQKPPRGPRRDRRGQRSNKPAAQRPAADNAHPLPGVVLESLSGTTTASSSHSAAGRSTQTEPRDPRRRRERGNPGAWDRPWRQRARTTL